MTGWTVCVAILALAVTTLPVALADEAPATTQPTESSTPCGFLYKTIEFEGETYAYAVYVPPDYTPDRAWPVILFLHGSGERGSDGFKQTQVGIGTAIRNDYTRVPAVVVMPQCRDEKTWVGDMGNMALHCLEQTSREYNLDPHRVYLTGLSLGGQGVLFMAASLPGRFAAVVSVCGFVELGQKTGVAISIGRRLKGTPLWMFHGEADTVISVAHPRRLVEDFRRQGCEVQYTEYANSGHAIWDRAYGEEGLWTWLFKQKLPDPHNTTEEAAPQQ
jgi:predicted peptidase